MTPHATRLMLALALSSFLAPMAWAQTYRCKQADGQTTFQDQPCETGSTGGPMRIMVAPASASPPPSQATRRAAPSAAARDLDARALRAEADAKARSQQAEAYSRAVRCNNARRSLGALKAERPVFQYDNNGNRKYLDDSQRQTEMAAAQRSVSESCD